MYTSVVLVALSGYFTPTAAVPERPAWLSEYTLASKLGAAEKKPMAVFLGTGKYGWDKLASEGTLGKDAKHLLDSSYVCLWVDTSETKGKELAEAFGVTGGSGIVISDRMGELQAFRHSGELKNGDLDRYLRKYADPNLIVRTTETHAEHQAQTSRPVQYSAPVMYSGGGRSC